MEVRFVADSHLGKLAKWLRIIGYDTVYRTLYKKSVMAGFVREGRTLLSRNRETVTRHATSLFIHADQVKDQLHELKRLGAITPDRSRRFSRCLICNVPLEEARATEVRRNVPEYVYYQSTPVIRVCPSCGRYFWPGSHRERMNKQLREWEL